MRSDGRESVKINRAHLHYTHTHTHAHTGCENNNIIVITIIRLFINVVDTLLEWGDGAYLSPHLDNVQRYLPLILTVVIDLLTVNNVLMSPLSANTCVFLS